MIKKFFILMLLIASFTACTSGPNDNTLTCKLSYFEHNNPNQIVFTESHLKALTNNDAIKELYSLLSHPSDRKFVSAIPKNVHLLDSSYDDGICNLTLSPTYNDLSADARAALNFALSSTMLTLPETRSLAITCGEETLTFAADSFISTLPQTYYDSYVVNLYYVNKDYTDAVPTEKTIQLSGEKTLERAVVELLMAGSGSADVISPFPTGTVLNDVYIDGGTCIVDVSSQFITSAKHRKEEETTILYSIVNTLTELPKIDSVKFLIDGNDGYGYVYYTLSAPLTNAKELLED